MYGTATVNAYSYLGSFTLDEQKKVDENLEYGELN
jgi:hypothetical protein